MKIANVVGARPNFMKMAPIIAAIAHRKSEASQVLIHTGQHYDQAMSGSFFSDLGMPAPDINLEVGSGSHAEQTARVMLAFESVVKQQKPDWIIVVGDVNSTLACALVAAKLCIKVAHVEAGLRSFDWSMPEEVNRVLTDRLSDLLFTPSSDADENLKKEGIDPSKIVRVGNVMIDTLFRQKERAKQSRILADLGLEPDAYATLTLHRPSNVDDSTVFRRLCAAFAEIGQRIPIVFPAHPRTQARMKEFGISIPNGVRMMNPLGYVDFLQLWSHSRLVLTDSGGLQEETTALGIPCLTLRENTERPITVTEGTNQVVGCEPGTIVKVAFDVLHRPRHDAVRIPQLWDGRAAERIAEALIARSGR